MRKRRDLRCSLKAVCWPGEGGWRHAPLARGGQARAVLSSCVSLAVPNASHGAGLANIGNTLTSTDTKNRAALRRRVRRFESYRGHSRSKVKWPSTCVGGHFRIHVCMASGVTRKHDVTSSVLEPCLSAEASQCSLRTGRGAYRAGSLSGDGGCLVLPGPADSWLVDVVQV
jgi:hypothetical protein